MNKLGPRPLNDAELKKLAEHKAWFALLSGFLCIACTLPRKKEEFGRFGVFQPTKSYTKIELPITYILCKGCNELPDDEIYQKTEIWLVKHGQLVP